MHVHTPTATQAREFFPLCFYVPCSDRDRIVRLCVQISAFSLFGGV